MAPRPLIRRPFQPLAGIFGRPGRWGPTRFDLTSSTQLPPIIVSKWQNRGLYPSLGPSPRSYLNFLFFLPYMPSNAGVEDSERNIEGENAI